MRTVLTFSFAPNGWNSHLGGGKTKMIFVNSMSDLFHKQVPFSFLDRAFDTMERAHWHKFQILTKRSSRLRDYVNARYADGSAPQHIWLGTSIEDGSKKSRARHIQATNATVRFLWMEPLLGPIGKIDLEGIHWVIVGGESGPRARPMLVEWAREVRDQCKAAKVPFFFKQWGGPRQEKNPVVELYQSSASGANGPNRT